MVAPHRVDQTVARDRVWMRHQERGEDNLLPPAPENYRSAGDDHLEGAKKPELDQMCHATYPR
jgi:hypothetical protein